MAKAAVKNSYPRDAVNGSLAYDLDRPVAEEYLYSAPVDIPAAPRTTDEVVPESVAVPKQAIAPMAVLGFAVAAVLLVLSLMARAQLSTASEAVSELESQITALQEEQDKLLIGYESAFNLTEIEDYAINELGMQKPRSDQLYYVNSTAQDKAVILAEDAERVGLADRFGDFISSIVEYFS